MTTSAGSSGPPRDGSGRLNSYREVVSRCSEKKARCIDAGLKSRVWQCRIAARVCCIATTNIWNVVARAQVYSHAGTTFSHFMEEL
jgi:hypothetical protein